MKDIVLVMFDTLERRIAHQETYLPDVAPLAISQDQNGLIYKAESASTKTLFMLCRRQSFLGMRPDSITLVGNFTARQLDEVATCSRIITLRGKTI